MNILSLLGWRQKVQKAAGDLLGKVKCPKCEYRVFREHLKGDGCLACYDEKQCSQCDRLQLLESGICSSCRVDDSMQELKRAIENWCLRNAQEGT